MKEKADLIKLEALSSEYQVRRLKEQDMEDILELCSENKIYYEYCPPFVTGESVRRDMEALPPGKRKKDKYFAGYFREGRLIALLDLITGYPNQDTAYIGFFMVDVAVSGRGVGTAIVEELCEYLKKKGFRYVELAWVKGNPQAERFWKKNQFQAQGEKRSAAAWEVIAARRSL